MIGRWTVRGILPAPFGISAPDAGAVRCELLLYVELRLLGHRTSQLRQRLNTRSDMEGMKLLECSSHSHYSVYILWCQLPISTIRRYSTMAAREFMR
jgi:hypothetical protein